MKQTLLTFLMVSLIFIAIPHKIAAAENLQTIIDSLEEGAVLQLDDQTYEGNLVIEKSIKIVGAKHTVIKGDGTWKCDFGESSKRHPAQPDCDKQLDESQFC
ncbi:hypothetical protein [Bacillus sp. T3]|uniref:hypothetical protein n=1 Tax=Bacillus sp. T3 TaxID=467262 RepID=UPI002981551E|nr:hypothetical protein [Bacillus sp. T3]